MSNAFRWDAQAGKYVNSATEISGEGQMPNAGKSAGWMPSDQVMIALLRMSLRSETRARLAAQRSVRIQENVTELLIKAVRSAGQQQEVEILRLHSELGQVMRDRDAALKEIVRLKVERGRSVIREWVKM